MSDIRLTIDGRAVTATAGATVLQAATAAGIHIPTICDHKDLSPFGACRMCVVEIQGVRGYPTSCTTPAAEGMVVRTATPEVARLRQGALELMMSAHPESCLVCDHREQCEKFRPKEIKSGKTTRCASCSNRPSCGVRTLSLSGPKRELGLTNIYLAQKLERDDPFMDRDHNLCILCGLCYRMCEKLHGTPAISIVRRGAQARIGTAFDRPYAESGCTFCGACIDICPTGTFTDRFAKWHGAPTQEVPSVCTLCPQVCELTVFSQGRTCLSTAMRAFTPEARLCAVGRFAWPQVMAVGDRLLRPLHRSEGALAPVSFEGAVKGAAQVLESHRDGSFVALVGEEAGEEAVWAWTKFAREVMGGRVGVIPFGGRLEDVKPAEVGADLAAGAVKAAVVAGGWLDSGAASKVPHLVVVDFRPSPASSVAEVVLPVAVLGEVGLTVRGPGGALRRQAQVVTARGFATGDLELATELSRALGTELGQPQPKAAGTTAAAADPRLSLKALPARYRGHLLADLAPALKAFGLPFTEPTRRANGEASGFEVVQRREVAPNFHLIELKVPQVASFAKAGQFVIVMPTATSERTPYTLGDWDAERGTITIVVEEVGRSSRELAQLEPGHRVAHVTGPLGAPYPIPTGATVALGGGCYGIAAIHPIARALKQAGNHVIGVLEGCSDFSLYFEQELSRVCDEVRIATKDGSKGTKGGVGEVFSALLTERPVDRFVAIGCTFMMMLTSEQTKASGVPLDVALNPIMVDGTGMCGACRLSVGGKTKFACVDGPLFDGHQVDWQELAHRRGAYSTEEVEALPQGARHSPEPRGAGACAGGNG